MRTYLTEAEVAARLRVGPAHFKRDWRKLRAAGFPRPLPLKGEDGSRRFDPVAIERWQNSFVEPGGAAVRDRNHPAIRGSGVTSVAAAANDADAAGPDDDSDGDPVGDLLAARSRAIAERG